MSPQVCFFASIGFSLVAWAIVTRRYAWPRLRLLPGPAALRPILILHSFRFIGLAFLVPGVVSPELPSTFAHLAAYGDIIAATFALLSLAAPGGGLSDAIVWIFNLWGTADLVDAFYQAARGGLLPGQLGAAFFIPTLLVPLLLITHGVAFRLLLRRESASRATVPRALETPRNRRAPSPDRRGAL
jgi:hypothetical protein